ncbi:iron-siderophore ABC transporter substrate-binding protein [Nodularia sp. LEGE 06071]|uniref:iron-siderophore ABC transporter substrate-binding protein n=1 Tax=unclassified Nodularia (in: cyanobacteria) TaxID=2656917 RepID=UPI001882573F|nr:MULTISPECIES: iron-siderophore ABC transporter substrate-binding protein [unclassified Nodularia (in: cyanobacteria)]MBE9200483.1 iron-siderophore ABC transporter substrate-binding protein [Nodularia sp. LEGE 06071]MCC2695265.1 iron-siderophore ABC transporter substrate-binding protein [Nodularia sp. LEGE 04288]
MIRKCFYYIKLFLIITLAVIFLKGCYTFTAQETYSSKVKLIKSECRIIKHELGESCIPQHPQRIIVTDQESLEILVALGLNPIAATTANRVGNKSPILKEKISGIINLGKESQPNLEKIVKLRPDLIVGFSFSPQNYQLFSRIAPTVCIEYTETGWKKTLLQVANIVDKTEQAEKLLEKYQQRIENLRLKFAQKLGNSKISVMRFYTTLQFTQFLNQLSFPVSILEELNLSIPLAQRQISSNANVSYNNVSLERVDLLESDAMFIALDPGSEENLQKYQNSPLWQKLNVVKNNRVYTVDSGYWIFGNILSANAILDDLVKYLLEWS